jgi:acyl-coenzyme A thioesterase 13
LNEQHYYTTINNVIDYFAVARQGETIIADTSIVRKGKQMANVQCEIWNENRTKLLAKGSSNLLQINVKKPD